jgi:hypothetical protein
MMKAEEIARDSSLSQSNAEVGLVLPAPDLRHRGEHLDNAEERNVCDNSHSSRTTLLRLIDYMIDL